MIRKEIADSFEQIIEQSDRMGADQFLYDDILTRSEELVLVHEQELVSVMRDWLDMRTRPQTPLAINVADRLCLAELQPDLDRLRDDVAAGKCFHYLYRRALNEVMGKLKTCH